MGPPEFDPKALVKLLVYGDSYGNRSSRKLERATYHNLSFIWLLGGLKPDHKTIARFRRNHKSALGNILKQCARLCLKLGLIEGNTLFVDGTKIRANASTKHIWTKKRCDDVLKQTDCQIEALLSECEATDQAEEDQASLVEMQEELKNKEALKSKVQDILKELKDTSQTSINTTAPDSRRMKSRQGSHASYNMQNTVDDKEGLYANTDDLKTIDDQQIDVVVPSQKQATSAPPDPFDKAHFSYDSANDIYTRPEGNVLSYRSTDTEKNKKNIS